VARNRKRAKERRARRPQPVASRTRDQLSGAPGPLEHATPNAELAEQAELPPDHQLELSEADEEEFEAEAEAEAEEYEEQAEPELGGDGGGGGGDGGRGGAGFGRGDGGEFALPGGPVSEPRPRPSNRLLTFLEGSWAELQRVQWPDRRQVMQATGVVLGFVLIAGIWLGVADWAAKHLINFILYGHF
jgi:preprotein translocase SecE subunit